MEEKDFIIEKLKELSNIFSFVRIRYVFDELYSQHVIEVCPDLVYSSSEFAKKQIELEIALINEYPSIEVLFVTEGHDLNLPNFDFVISGSKHTGNYILSNSSFIEVGSMNDFLNINTSHELPNYRISETVKVYGGGDFVSLENAYIGTYNNIVLSENKDFKFYSSEEILIKNPTKINVLEQINKDKSILNSILLPESKVSGEENSYAMAA